ncbi:nucleolar complex protein 14 [Bachmanniomyces sp. S44760]|nr:nucleolar complex protein 14 [Bachmanniomyces sp. S44760]
MPPSQLKRLKASLKEQGLVGPQQSKKQKKQNVSKHKRVHRNVALQGIREEFNPFEVKQSSKGSKYEFTNVQGSGKKSAVVGRPGVTKGLGEENRRKTLLVEMQRRKKIGGIFDRRFGEDDPGMTPDEKALERFVREKQKGKQKGSLFNLEDEDVEEEDGEFTHLGKPLTFEDGQMLDNFNEAGSSIDEDDDIDGLRPSKRRRLSDESVSSSKDEGSYEAGEDTPERRKTKQEVMKEVIAKSKLHKYERQKAKEDDDDLRAELDQGLSDIYALMNGTEQQQHPPERTPDKEQTDNNTGMNPDRAALLNGKDRYQADKEYDERLRQMAMDKRAQPTVRTKTEEERLEEDAQRLKILEDRRLKRMRGEEEFSDNDNDAIGQDAGDLENGKIGENDLLNLGDGISNAPERKDLGVEDEDEFLIEDDLIASETDVDASESTADSKSDSPSEEDDEFVIGLLSTRDAGRDGLPGLAKRASTDYPLEATKSLAFTYSCPQTHDELLSILKDIPVMDLPIIIQRIRTLYHPTLDSGNKAKLSKFAAILIDHLVFLANQSLQPPFEVLETLIRHIHSLAKTFPDEVSRAFRSHLLSLHEKRPTAPTPGDLLVFTAISSIYPTSDHFHQVVTPAMLSMARYLGQKPPQSLADLAKGAYVGTLCLQYQKLSKRYVPELVNYALFALHSLSPATLHVSTALFPRRDMVASLRLKRTPETSKINVQQIDFWDIEHGDGVDSAADDTLKIALLEIYISLVDTMSTMWTHLSSFPEICQPFTQTLHLLLQKPDSDYLPSDTKLHISQTHTHLSHLSAEALRSRRPLRLHNHRPLAIKTSLPKFEETYVPGKHYDPDRERSELAKLKKEHKREKKGAMRELRKDANFIARETLREKKERDEEYERKFKKLVASIQTEEGREGNIYEREKRLRKGRK